MNHWRVPQAQRGLQPLRAALLALGLLGAGLTSAHAEVLAAWDVHALTGGTNGFGASPLAASVAAANVTVSGLTRGTGVGSTGSAAARAWGGNSWTASSAAAAATAGQLASLTLTANAGYQLSFAALSRLDYRRSSSGPANGVLQYRLGSGAFSDAAVLSYPSTASSGGALATINLSGIAALQNVPSGVSVTFRIVNHGASAAGGTWYLYDAANTTAADLEIIGTATLAGPVVDGSCGPALNLSYATAPTANLCTAGSPSAVMPNGNWSWTCAGSNGGGTASCSAVNTSATGC